MKSHIFLSGLLVLGQLCVYSSCGLRQDQSSEYLTSPASPDTSGEEISPIHSQNMEIKLFHLANRFRQAQGKNPLKYDPRIASIARGHSENMGRKVVPFGHAGDQGRFDEISKFVFFNQGGEVVAYNYEKKGPEEMALKQWENSPLHRELLLRDWDEEGRGVTGVGIAQDSQGRYYFTQMFIGVPEGE